MKTLKDLLEAVVNPPPIPKYKRIDWSKEDYLERGSRSGNSMMQNEDQILFNYRQDLSRLQDRKEQMFGNFSKDFIEKEIQKVKAKNQEAKRIIERRRQIEFDKLLKTGTGVPSSFFGEKDENEPPIFPTWNTRSS